MSGLPLLRRIRNFSRRDRFVRYWLFPAWIGLGLASLAISTVSFRRLAPRLGDWRGVEKPTVSLTAPQVLRARQVGETIRLAARFAPWRADCYPQAILARLMLGMNGIPYTLAMGVKRDAADGAMLAHAWVQCGSVSVTGGDGDAEYRAVAIFAGGTAG